MLSHVKQKPVILVWNRVRISFSTERDFQTLYLFIRSIIYLFDHLWFFASALDLFKLYIDKRNFLDYSKTKQ